jgi:peptidoglycan/LPS O-acetylase OafA/YrhL
MPPFITREARALTPSASSPRLDALTGLRFFAALAVYCSHMQRPPDLHPQLSALLGNGSLGVTCFFVLSGFVLAYTYFDRLRQPSICAIWSYTVARFARIYPVYILVLLSIIYYFTAWNPPDGWQWHVLMLQAWSADLSFAYGLNGAAWSVSVELFLYACFPFLVPLVARRDGSTRSLVVAALATVALMWLIHTAFWLNGNSDLQPPDAASGHRWLYRSPVGRLGDLLFGMILARLYLRLIGRPGVALVASISAVLLVAATLLQSAYRPALLQPYRFDFIYMLLGGLLILSLALSPRGPVSLFLGWAPIVLFGEASYAFYLIHQLWMSQIGAGIWVATGTLTGLAWELLVPVKVLAIAIVVHLAFERPMRTLIRSALDPSRVMRAWHTYRGARPESLALVPAPVEPVRTRWTDVQPIDGRTRGTSLSPFPGILPDAVAGASARPDRLRSGRDQ